MQIEIYQLIICAAILAVASAYVGWEIGHARHLSKIEAAESRGYNRGMIDQQIATAKVYVLHRKRKGIK